MRRIAAFTLAAGSLAACASPTPPTFTAADVASSQTTYDTFTALPSTSLASMPTAGVATFSGLIGGDFTAASDADGGFIGDLDFTVDFASAQIAGTANNLNFVDDAGVPDQTLGGALTVSGTVTGNAMTATATGRLTGVYKGFSGSSNFNLGLAGVFHTKTTAADTVAGTVTGVGRGDYYAAVTNGEFYAVQQ